MDDRPAGKAAAPPRLTRRGLIKVSAAGAAAGAVGATGAAANHWLPPDPRRPPGHYGTPGEGTDEGDIPQPKELPREPGPTIKTVHHRGDAVITRYQGDIDATDFGAWGDPRTGLIYISQRLTDHIAVFDRNEERYVEKHWIPTQGSGAHAIKVDVKNNSVWFAAGESSRIGRLVLDPVTHRPRNFVEYSTPGDIRTERKPHGLVVVGDAVWYTDDRGDRVGFLDVNTGLVHQFDEHVEADGINVEERWVTVRGRRGRKRRKRRLRIWVGGGQEVTIFDGIAKRLLHRITIPEEPGFAQLRVHDIHYEPRSNRVFVLLRGSDHIVWFDADNPQKGARGWITPGRPAAGLDHIDLGRNYMWWTEGAANNITRYDLRTGQVTPYLVPNPTGYFNPHGIYVSREWREVWFTEREALCKLTFRDGRSP